MSFALERYLKDFGPPQVTPHPQALSDFSSAPMHEDVAGFDFGPAEQHEPDPEEIRANAYAEGYEAASAELSVRHEETLARIEAEHAAALADLARRYEEEAAQRITGALRAIAAELADRVSSEVALCLAPIIQSEIAEKAVADMAVLIQEAVLEGAAGPIIVKGPLPLFNILATEMGDDATLLRHVEADDLDLSVEIGGSVLVTRLSAFAASLKKVME